MSTIIKLSRSTVEKYLTCPRCCVLDKKYQIKPPSLPEQLIDRWILDPSSFIGPDGDVSTLYSRLPQQEY